MYRTITNKNLIHTNILTNFRSLTFTRPFSFTKPMRNIGPGTSKIFALPFKLSPERAPQVVDLANYITEHKFLGFFRLMKSMFLKTLPQVSNTSNIQIKKAYLPVWYYDMAIKANVTRQSDDVERELLCVGLNNYWTGHTWDPMCYLSLGFPVTLDKSALVPFTAIGDMGDCDEEDDIEIIPFTTDPFQDLAQQVSSALEGLQIGRGKLAVDISKAELVFGAAYPVYFPVYIAQVASDKDTVIVVGGHSKNPPVFKYTPVKPKAAGSNNNDEDEDPGRSTTTTSTKQWLNNGEWIRLDVTDPTWRVGLPISPLQDLCKTFVDKVVNNQGDGKTLASKARQPIQWDDARIQAYPTYQQGNKDYIEQLYKVWAQQGMMTQLEHMDGKQRTLGMGKNGLEMKSAEEFREEILNSIGNDLQKLEQVEPQWLKDYNQQVIQENSNKDQNVDQ